MKTTVLAMYGMDAALQPFVNDLKELVCPYKLFMSAPRQGRLLEHNNYYFICIDVYFVCVLYTCQYLDVLTHLQEKGFSFKLHGIRQRYYGALAIVSGDNLGSLALGGFKESCTATHPCRQCMATREAAKTQVCIQFLFRAPFISPFVA